MEKVNEKDQAMRTLEELLTEIEMECEGCSAYTSYTLNNILNGRTACGHCVSRQTRVADLIDQLKKTDFKNIIIVTRDINKNIMDVSIFRCTHGIRFFLCYENILNLGTGQDFESKIIEQKDLVLYTHLKYKDPLFFKLLEEYGN
jgi:hypothetical protein